MKGHDELWKFIKDKKDYLKSLDITITDHPIGYGDRYYSESGMEYRIDTPNHKYCVGYSTVTEDDDDWAQAEAHQTEWCKKDEEYIDCEIVLHELENYKSINRDNKIKILFNSIS